MTQTNWTVELKWEKNRKFFITSCMIPFWTFLISFSVFSFSFLFNNINTFVMCVCVVWKFLLRWIIILILCTKTENEIQFRKKTPCSAFWVLWQTYIHTNVYVNVMDVYFQSIYVEIIQRRFFFLKINEKLKKTIFDFFSWIQVYIKISFIKIKKKFDNLFKSISMVMLLDMSKCPNRKWWPPIIIIIIILSFCDHNNKQTTMENSK